MNDPLSEAGLGVPDKSCVGELIGYIPAGRPLVQGSDCTPHAGKCLGWVIPALALGLMVVMTFCVGTISVFAVGRVVGWW